MEVFKLVQIISYKGEIRFVSLLPKPYPIRYILGEKATPLVGPLFAYDNLNAAKLAIRNKLTKVMLICEAEQYVLDKKLYLLPVADLLSSEQLSLFWKNPETWWYDKPITYPKWGVPPHTILCSWVRPLQVYEP